MTDVLTNGCVTEVLTELCPLCEEDIFRPRALPCSHRFCLECLDSYIFRKTSNTSVALTCPKCDRIARPVRPDSVRGFWAEEFPETNVPKSKGLAFGVPACLPCQEKGDDVAASDWCRNCKVLFCSFCRKFHDSIHRRHVVFDVREYQRREAFFRGKSFISKKKEEKNFICNFRFTRACSLTRLFPTASIVGKGVRFESMDR
ncbi:tripartite motif-containing protein 10-like [Mizuhopecten yessoensis]|uniref:tripartite motif-containing protein 10-like n=1 Tax=Mizuhopecten yessoensis TaxID=6573 RepID=UPI000B45C54C|nr:tripartite motif-containing protein 10-like [Mizuhopecten yessoensis]